MIKIRYLYEQINKKKVAIIFLLFLLSLVFVFTFVAFFVIDNINIYAYNRDSNSGTREAFEEAINFDSDNEKYSKNVFEVSGNDIMFTNVKKNPDSIGYVSLDTAYDQYGNPTNPDVMILGTETIQDPTEIMDRIDEYEAKRPFNVFFRASEATSEEYHLTDNLYINSLNASSKNTQANIWDSSFDPSIWGMTSDDFIVHNDLEAKFAVSYLFFNWLFYSQDAHILMSLPYEPLDLSLFPYYETNPGGLNDPTQNFIDNTDLYNYLNLAGYNDSKRLKIQSCGSTSVLSLLTILMQDSEYGFLNMCENYGLYITHEANHLGSGDAFKLDNTPSSRETFLGFQSRGFKEEEITGSSWNFDYTSTQDYTIDESNYTVDLNTEANNGFYNPRALSENGSNLLYGSFYIDAIVFITNTNLAKKTGQSNWWISMEGVHNIYVNNASFNDLYSSGMMGYN